MHTNFDWDDLKIFLAAARAGSLAGASHKLGLDAATVGRRVARLESAFKCTLLARSASGLQLTSAGHRLMETALDAETAMLAAGCTGETDIVGGAVRLSAAEGFGTAILAPALGSLRRQRPGLRIELAAISGFLSPIRREVDMAITFSAPDHGRLVVEPLTHYQLMLYASREYLERAGEPTSVEMLFSHELIGYIDDLIYAPELRFLDEVDARLRPALASSSIRAQQQIILSGGGIGILPCYLAQGLIPVLAEQVLLTRRFWISTHADYVDTARIKTVRHWLLELVAARQQDLSPY